VFEQTFENFCCFASEIGFDLFTEGLGADEFN